MSAKTANTFPVRKFFGFFCRISHLIRIDMDVAPGTDNCSAKKKTYSCDQCDVQFSSRPGLWRHNKNIHPTTAAMKSRTPKMKCGLCEELLFTQIDVCGHVSSVHSLPAAVQDDEFSSTKEFELWKKTEEDKKRCHFVKRQCDTQLNSSSSYFYCHRSGEYSSKGKGIRAPRKNISNRTGFQCTAFITARTDSNGRVYVQYCFYHYGHKNEIDRLPLPQSTRDEIAIHLMDDRSPDWIMMKLRGEFKNSFDFLSEFERIE